MTFLIKVYKAAMPVGIITLTQGFISAYRCNTIGHQSTSFNSTKYKSSPKCMQIF